MTSRQNIKMEDITKFFFELGQLKRVKRSGWWLAGIKDPESVAEHSFRAVIIGRIIAELENANKDKVTMMLLFHDVPEARINDTHKVGARYVNKAEIKVLEEQITRLPESIGKEIIDNFKEMDQNKTKEASIAKDADLLECAFQAKEYIEQNYSDCENWVCNVEKQLVTRTAKKIMNIMKKTKSNSWWYGLKHIEGLLKNKK